MYYKLARPGANFVELRQCEVRPHEALAPSGQHPATSPSHGPLPRTSLYGGADLRSGDALLWAGSTAANPTSALRLAPECLRWRLMGSFSIAKPSLVLIGACVPWRAECGNAILDRLYFLGYVNTTQSLTSSRCSTPSDMRARKVSSVRFAGLEVHHLQGGRYSSSTFCR